MDARGNDCVLDALQAIDPSQLDYAEWLKVGMGLKAAGFDFSTWDNWSSQDVGRYKQAEMPSKWDSFRKAGITAATIVHIAQDRFGWRRPAGSFYPSKRQTTTAEGQGTYDAEQEIPDLGELENQPPIHPLWEIMEPAAQTAEFINALFRPLDFVATNSKPSWIPAFNQAAIVSYNFANGDPDGAKLARLNANSEYGCYVALNPVMDPRTGAYVKDCPKEPEKSITFDPVRYQYYMGGVPTQKLGVSDNHVLEFRHTLIEHDDMDLDEQLRLILALNLPCAAITDSGGKSIHAVVKVDARDEWEFDERVRFLLEVCEKNGLAGIDHKNVNPARWTRLPGVYRGENGKWQRLIAVDRGAASWAEWVAWLQERSKLEKLGLPMAKNASDYMGENVPEQDEELVRGLLRRARVLQFTGPSKGGKSWAAIQFAFACATGGWWLGKFQVPKPLSVLYVNAEMQESEFMKRLDEVRKAMQLPVDLPGRLDVLTLRGRRSGLNEVAEYVAALPTGTYDVVVIDPLYKLEKGEENSSKDATEITWQIDAIWAAGPAVMYVHHHPKGATGDRATRDKGSGSGVLARHYDAQVDFSELVPDDAACEYMERAGNGKKPVPLRVSVESRGFPPTDDFNVWFEHPIHILDHARALDDCVKVGSRGEQRRKGGAATAAIAENEWAEKNDRIRRALDRCVEDNVPANRRNVCDRYNDLARKEGADIVQQDTFDKWTKPSGRADWCVSDAEHGYVLVPKVGRSDEGAV